MDMIAPDLSRVDVDRDNDAICMLSVCQQPCISAKGSQSLRKASEQYSESHLAPSIRDR